MPEDFMVTMKYIILLQLKHQSKKWVDPWSSFQVKLILSSCLEEDLGWGGAGIS